MKNYILSPSILSADFTRLGDQVAETEQAGAQYLHIDVMDGAFVPSITFGMPVIKSLRKQSSMFFDVHLMIQEPERFIDEFVECGADMITIHAEACVHLHRTLDYIQSKGIKAGIALCPSTSLNVLDYLWDKTDMVLLMTVNPGFGGQSYIPEMTDKIRQLREKINSLGREIDIEVDGGVNSKTIRTVLDAGANVLVAGSAVYGGNVTDNITELMDVMKEYKA